MEVKIRMRKVGKPTSKRYHFKIVAISKSKSRDGRFLEDLGYYDPTTKPATFNANREKIDAWVKKGAQLSTSVKNLLKNKSA
ncbi:MAG: 30S ribosomal protein S16 [Candidatus Omnitrophota bacterium]|nr:30S ribosomal protein S16 [Candidatus Omnitrophota bacterium]